VALDVTEQPAEPVQDRLEPSSVAAAAALPGDPSIPVD
jgi:hypothetical protein